MLSKVFYIVGITLQASLIVTVATAGYVYFADPLAGLRSDLNVTKYFHHAPGHH